MEKTRISLMAKATGSDLFLDFWFDGQLIGSMAPTNDKQDFSYEFVDTDRDHVFEIELRGKLPEHTKIDQQGNILQDRIVEISRVCLDEIELGHMFLEKSRYLHDHNGTTEPIDDEFFGVMGCNGKLRLEFSSPVYLWLLENM